MSRYTESMYRIDVSKVIKNKMENYIKIAYNQALKDACLCVKVKYIPPIPYDDTDGRYVVDTDTILNLMK